VTGGKELRQRKHVDERSAGSPVTPPGRHHKRDAATLDHEPCPGGAEQPLERVERRPLGAGLVGRDGGLRGVGAAREVGLGEASLSTGFSEFIGHVHVSQVYLYVYATQPPSPARDHDFTDLDGSQPDCWRYMAEVQDPGRPADPTGYR